LENILNTPILFLITKKASSGKGKSFSMRVESYYFFAKNSFTLSVGIILSLNANAPDLGDFTILITLAKSLPELCNEATTFLAMI